MLLVHDWIFFFPLLSISSVILCPRMLALIPAHLLYVNRKKLENLFWGRKIKNSRPSVCHSIDLFYKATNILFVLGMVLRNLKRILVSKTIKCISYTQNSDWSTRIKCIHQLLYWYLLLSSPVTLGIKSVYFIQF